MSEFLGIDIKALDDGIFQFYQTAFIRKFLEDTGMEHFNGLSTPTKVEAPIGTDRNIPKAKRYFTNSYASFVGMILYLVSNTVPDISFAIHNCSWFTYNTKASTDTEVRRIWWHLWDIKDKGLVLNPSKIMVVYFYVDADFGGLWLHDNSQDPICAKSIIVFVA